MSDSTMLDKLYYLESTKEGIRNALVERGLQVPNNLPFRQYPTLIQDLGANELEEHIQGKLSIIRALNNKFGLDIQREAIYPEIVEAINSIVVKNLQRSINIKSTLNFGNDIVNTKINVGTNKMRPIGSVLNVKSGLDYSDFTFTINQ